jgi:hypothetical protein
MKIFWFRVILIMGIALVCGLVLFAGYTYYRKRQPEKYIPGAGNIVPLPKGQFQSFGAADYPSYYEPKPDTDVTAQPSFLAEPVTYTINAEGFNDRYDYDTVKPEGTYRIMTLGDSFVYGQNVNTKDNWTELLEDSLRGRRLCPYYKIYEVLNLAVEGYDILFSSVRYRLHGQKYNPDMVIWFLNPHSFYLLRPAITQREQEIDAQMTKEERDSARAKGDYFPATVQAVRELYKKYSLDQIVKQETAGLYSFAQDFHGTLVVVANTMPVRYLDILNDFKNDRKDPTYIFSDITDINSIPDAVLPDRHPSIQGHEIYAQDILKFLEIQKIIACP